MSIETGSKAEGQEKERTQEEVHSTDLSEQTHQLFPQNSSTLPNLLQLVRGPFHGAKGSDHSLAWQRQPEARRRGHN